MKSALARECRRTMVQRTTPLDDLERQEMTLEGT